MEAEIVKTRNEDKIPKKDIEEIITEKYDLHY